LVGRTWILRTRKKLNGDFKNYGVLIEPIFISARSAPSRVIAAVPIKVPHSRDQRDPGLQLHEDEIRAILSAEVDKAMSLERQV
jgi:hypothetical protein